MTFFQAYPLCVVGQGHITINVNFIGEFFVFNFWGKYFPFVLGIQCEFSLFCLFLSEAIKTFCYFSYSGNSLS